MSRIDLNIVATGQFAQVESALARLRAQIAALNAQSMRIGGVSPEAIRSVQAYTDSFNASIDRSGMFERHMVNMTTETERFGKSLQQGRLRLSEYSRAMREYRRDHMGQIKQLAREQVRMMNATTMMMPDGRAQVIVPKGIDEAIDKQKILNQEYRIFRQTVQGASTQLINWGKNTQWAGRQLTVGLTVPLTIFGATAGKMFMDVDKELTRLGKVYGGTAGKIASPTQVAAIREQTQALAQELAGSMGIAAQETAGLAADIAATGKEGADLIAATRESVRLSVLGEVDRQEAMRATLAIQSVFKKSNEDLANSINFLNAVENQTSTTLNDLVTGIVKAGPVVEGLGGSIENLAMMMVAMREGGVPAAEAANAIKSSMGSLINPTKQTSEQFKDLGINLRGIVDKNAGDLIGTLTALQDELSALDDLSRQRAIEQLFGKYQFARINALLNNLGRAGSQTEEVLKLASLSTEELAKTAANELKILTESTSMRFKRALESLKANLVPIGETFVKIGTILLEIGNKVFEIFNSLPEPVQNFVKGLGLLVGIAGPIIMITGVMGNFFGYIVKGVGALLALKRAGRGVFEFFTPESVAAKTASELLTGAVYNQTEAFAVMNAALEALNQNLKEMTSNLSAAGGASANMAAKTMSAAEAAAVASGGVVQPDLLRNITYNKESKFGGFEASHIIPGLTGGDRGIQTGAMLLPLNMSAERDFQSLSQGWTPEFYDPSSGLSRQEFLAKNAYTPSAKAFIEDPANIFSDAGLQRLAPTKEEYMQGASSYLAGLKVLVNDIDDTSRDAIKSARASGDLPELRRLMEKAILDNDAAYKQYVTEISTSLEASGNTMEQMTRSAMAMETQMTAGSKVFNTTAGGQGMNRFLYAMMGGGIANLEASVRSAAQAVIDPLSMTGKEFLSAGRRAGLELVTTTRANGKKYILDMTNGLEQATVYAVNASTGEMTKLQGFARTAVLTNPETDAAVLRYKQARERLELITQLEIDQAAAAMNAAAGGAAGGPTGTGTDRPEARRRGRFGGLGMGALGVLSMASIFAPTGGNEEANASLNIAGMAGMGATLGMMAGPKGAAAGAAIGALAGVFTTAKSNMDEVKDNAKKLADSMSVGAETLNGMAEFFGGTLLSERASAASVLEGTGIRQKQLSQGQEYLASESGKAFVDGFSQAISSYGFNNAMDGVATNLANMIMQGAITFENAEGIAAALAEQLQMPELTANVTGKLRSIVGPNGQDITRKPISVAIELQQESARQFANMQASIITDELGKIENTGLQQVAMFAAGGPIIGSMLDSLGNMDIPGISGIVRDLRGFVNQDYSAAVAGVTTLGRTIGNQVRAAYDNLNSAVFRYNELEKEALAMKKGPERKRALAQLETEKRKIDELEKSYKQMMDQASSGFGKLIAQDAGLAAESLGAMSESLKETFAGTVEAPAMEALLGKISGMDQQIQFDVMLNISSGQLSPTGVMGLINSLGDDELGAKTLNILVQANGLTETNEFLLKSMQIEDEVVRKDIIVRFMVESGATAEDVAAAVGFDSEALDKAKSDYETALAEYQKTGTVSRETGRPGIKISLGADEAQAELDRLKAIYDEAQSAQSEFETQMAQGDVTEAEMAAARRQVRAKGGELNDYLDATAPAIADYTVSLQELGKLNIEPTVDLSETEVSENKLKEINDTLNQILQLPDEIVKSINIDDIQANNGFKKFKLNWDNVDSWNDIKKQIDVADGFSQTMNAFGLSYNEFAALPNIVKSMIMYYVDVYAKLNLSLQAALNAANPSGGEISGIANELSRLKSILDGLIGSSQGAGYVPPSSGGRAPTDTGSGDSGSGSGGKDGDKYKKLIEQQNKLIDGIRKERQERERIARLQEESLNFMLDQQSLQNEIARAKAEGNFAEAALLQARKDIEKEQRDRELAEDARQRAEDKEIEKRQQIIEILEKGGKFADKLAAALDKLGGRIPYGLLRGRGKKKADGGPIFGPGGPRSDVIPAMLSNGEFVMQADAVDKYGLPFMYMINNKTLPAFGGGGYSSRYPGMAARMYRGGLARKMYGSSSNESIEYNINVNVAGSNSSADEIAAEVLKAMQRRERMNRAVTRI